MTKVTSLTEEAVPEAVAEALLVAKPSPEPFAFAAVAPPRAESAPGRSKPLPCFPFCASTLGRDAKMVVRTAPLSPLPESSKVTAAFAGAAGKLFTEETTVTTTAESRDFDTTVQPPF